VARLSLKIRLIVGIAVSMLPLLIVILVSYAAFNDLLTTMEEITEESIEEVTPIIDLEDLLEQAERLIQAGIWHPDTYDDRAYLDLVPLIDQAFATAGELPFGKTDEIDGIMRSHELWVDVRERWREIQASGLGRAEVVAATQGVASGMREACFVLERIKSIALGEVKDGREEERRWRKSLNLFLPLVLVVGIGIAAAIANSLIKAIIEPLRALEQGAQHLARGELSYRVGELSRDELGDLARSFNLMAQKLQQSHQTLEGLSNLDFLTGLANVREFYRLFHDEIRRAERYQHHFSLIILDVDEFKQVNDNFGHQAGDLVLQEVGRKLRDLVRNIDHVARIGGDEFAILFPETNRGQARELAERIRGHFDSHLVESVQSPVTPLRITISLGLGTYPTDARQANDLFAMTDQALYRAKREGRNRLCLAEKTA
jgi:diguanylate cyclase (GGDEF)-like protein